MLVKGGPGVVTLSAVTVLLIQNPIRYIKYIRYKEKFDCVLFYHVDIKIVV